MKYYSDADIKGNAVSKPNYLGEKNEKYFRQWAWYAYRQYLFNRGVVASNGAMSHGGKPFTLLRQYALGIQNPSIYRDILDPCEGENKDQGFMNISWDNVQILPKFRDIVKGKMLDMEFDVQTKAIDETANKERLHEVSKMKLLANPKMQALFAKVGTQPDMKLPEGVQTPQEIDILDKLGGLRMEYEIAMKDLYDVAIADSDYKTIQAQKIDDLIDFNMCASKIKLEKRTNKVKVEYVNPIYVVAPASKYPDHHDIDFAGEIKIKTISELRQETKLSEPELAALAEKSRGFDSWNNGFNNFDSATRNEFYGNRAGGGFLFNNISYPYDSVRVRVLDFYFYASDAEDYLVGAMPSEEVAEFKSEIDEEMGEEILGERDSDSDEDDKKLKAVYQCVYHAQWIIGTDTVFDYGKEYGVVMKEEDGVKRAILPIQIWADRAPSLVERCIGFVDDIQLATLKKRNALQAIPPGPRLQIDLSRLRKSVTIGKRNYNMLDLLNIYTRTGRLIYESEDEEEEGPEGSRRPPIETQQQTGIETDLQIFLNEIEFNINMIRGVTGVNEVADGTSQKADMLNGVMEGLNAATNNALRPITYGYENHTKNEAVYICQKWQVAVLGGEINISFIPIGDSILRSVKATRNLFDYDFGIFITLKPSAQDRQMLLQAIQEKRQQNLISEPDFLVLWNMIQVGDIKKAQLFYATAVEKEKAHQQQMQMEQIKANAEANAKAAADAENAKIQTLQAEYQLKIQLEKVKGEEARKTAQLEHQNKMDELRMQHGQQLEQDVVNAAMTNELPAEGGTPLPQT